MSIRIPNKKKGERVLKKLKEQHFDQTVEKTLPTAARQFAALEREMKSIRKEIEALKKRTNPMWKEWKEKQLREEMEVANGCRT